MRLTHVTLQYFRNFVEPQTIAIEPDVTCLVGKNESGKTTILQAMHRVNPANGNEADNRFDLTTEYPRWRLARDRRRNPGIQDPRPISLTFALDDEDIASLRGSLPCPPPAGATVTVSKTYSNDRVVELRAPLEAATTAAAVVSDLDPDEVSRLLGECHDLQSVREAANARAGAVRDLQPLQSKAWTSFAAAIGNFGYLFASELPQDTITALLQRIPKTFYFSSYENLPGEVDLTELANKMQKGQALAPKEQTVVALLRHAGEQPEDFLDENYDSRKAELQAASVDLSRHAFEYWRQNPDLEVAFDTDNISTGKHPNGGDIMHRILKIELRDGRHGGVETNFETRSYGFRWFFSFFAAFSAYQDSEEPLLVLLDEPGTSLHGDAQRDFVRFIVRELGASKQTIYTTHSQHMIDPAKYEKLRAVHDRATRKDPDLGVAVTRIDLTADRDTILPLESALGYSVSQHLFLGSGQHLVVEGSSDFVYLQRMTEYLLTQGKKGLDPRLAMIPVGGADNMPAFVALLGRRLRVSALVDGARTTKRFERIRAAAKDNGVDEKMIIVCADVDDSLPRNADVEDLFDAVDYLRLYNWTFGTNVAVTDLPATTEPLLVRLAATCGGFDHALPAHTLTDRREEFFASVGERTVSRFSDLFDLLNATVRDQPDARGAGGAATPAAAAIDPE